MWRTNGRPRHASDPTGPASDSQVERIEAEKLKAVGLRNRVAALEEVRWSTRQLHKQNGTVAMPSIIDCCACRSDAGSKRTKSGYLLRSKKS